MRAHGREASRCTNLGLGKAKRPGYLPTIAKSDGFVHSVLAEAEIICTSNAVKIGVSNPTR